MTSRRAGHGLIDRERESDRLSQALSQAGVGKGQLVLVAGEAGVGKTSLVNWLRESSGRPWLSGAATETGTPSYGPVASVLRQYLRVHPDGFSSIEPVGSCLSLLLPELGPAPHADEQGRLSEAVRAAFEFIASREPAVIFLDDMQWADSATFDLLTAMAPALNRLPLLVVVAYRSDEISRFHPIRRLRNELRRTRQLNELIVEGLSLEGVTRLAERISGERLSPQLAISLHDRTQGLPFFLEELTIALLEDGRLHRSEEGLALLPGQALPVPETVRDAILVRLDGLSARAQELLERAAVAGTHFELEAVVDPNGEDDSLDELTRRGLIAETRPGLASFRHALTREAIYGQITWSRRRTLHRQLALHLRAKGVPPAVVAEHWLAANEREQARTALIASCLRSCQLHAYRDAALAAQRALELWPEGEDETGRLDLLERYANCAQLGGLIGEATRAWSELAVARRHEGERKGEAQALTHLASLHEAQGSWSRAVEARQGAARAFASEGLPGEAAAERLAAAMHLHVAGSFRAALELIATVLEEAREADRPDLTARALGEKGELLAKLGDSLAGRETAEAGLTLALAHELTGAAAEIYQKLAGILEQVADYTGARDVYMTAIDFCREHEVPVMGQLCMACVAGVLWQVGDWQRALSHCREVLASAENPPPVRAVAAGYLGILLACRGEAKRARKHLHLAVAQARHYEIAALELISCWGLAVTDALDEAYDEAAERSRALILRWELSEETHYIVPPLRWAVTFFARRGATDDARACAAALSRVVGVTPSFEALAALSHAIGEVALLEGEHRLAANHFQDSLRLLRRHDVPFQQAETGLRAGAAMVAAGDRETGIDHIVTAHRIARRLDARPLAVQAAQELVLLGEKVEERLGRLTARQLKQGGLTRRQLQILRLVAAGRSNKEIARELEVSPRTVDMHVGNILERLDCRSRTEAVFKANELRLLG